jgi:hypothetical protein
MFKKSIAVVFAIAFAMTATVASAQLCNVAAYADPGGTISIVEPTYNWDEGASFSFYTVMYAEDTANAVAYKLNIDHLNTFLFVQARLAGPSRTGLTLDENPPQIGTNVALGECVIGFGGFPILVEEYQVVTLPGYAGGEVTITQNTNQNDLVPEYATCNGIQKDCASGPALVISVPVPTEATSFGKIKSLYN